MGWTMRDRKTEQRVGVRDVARHAGVAKSTAAYVLSRSSTHKVSRETEQKVLAAARELGYVPNRMAAGLKTGRSGLIGVYFGQVEPPHTHSAQGDTHFVDLFDGLTAACLQYDVFPISLVHGNDSAERDTTRIDRLVQAGIDGLIAFLPGQQAVSVLRQLAERGFPVVSIFQEVEGCDLTTIDVDNVMMGEMAVDYLVQRGYRALVALREPDRAPSTDDRERGFRQACARYGIEPRVVVLPSRWELPFLEFHSQSAKIIRALEADALFAMTAGTTLMVGYNFADKAFGWTPDRCGFLGVDVALMQDFRLITHFTAPWDVIARRAVDLVWQRIENGGEGPCFAPRIAPHRVDGETCPDRRAVA